MAVMQRADPVLPEEPVVRQSKETAIVALTLKEMEAKLPRQSEETEETVPVTETVATVDLRLTQAVEIAVR